MADMININVIIDEECVDPRVDIYTQKETELVENIIYSIENLSRTKYPPVLVYDKGSFRVLSQRDVMRIRTEGREVIVDTVDGSFTAKGTLAKFEDELDQERFFRISQSEIINLYKVNSFNFSISGTVEVLFENEVRSYVARRCIKPLRDKLKKIYCKAK